MLERVKCCFVLCIDRGGSQCAVIVNALLTNVLFQKASFILDISA